MAEQMHRCCAITLVVATSEKGVGTAHGPVDTTPPIAPCLRRVHLQIAHNQAHNQPAARRMRSATICVFARVNVDEQPCSRLRASSRPILQWYTLTPDDGHIHSLSLTLRR